MHYTTRMSSDTHYVNMAFVESPEFTPIHGRDLKKITADSYWVNGWLVNAT